MGQGETGNKHKRKGMKLVTFYKFCITVNNWCDKECAVKYLEETLRTYLGEDFSIVIEFESLSWGHVIDLYVGWCNEEDEY